MHRDSTNSRILEEPHIETISTMRVVVKTKEVITLVGCTYKYMSEFKMELDIQMDLVDY